MNKVNLLNVLKRITIGGAMLIGISSALAGPVDRAYSTVQIRAGVVILNSNKVGATVMNDDPFVWYNLNQNRLVKPAGWDFYNPLAAATLSQASFDRWASISGLLGVNGPPAVGTRLTKQDAPYWEVPLAQITDAEISNYDVLLMPVHEYLSLNPSERAKLQRFMDQGGVLWVDTAYTTQVDAGNSTPISFALFQHGGSSSNVSVDSTSPLLTYPYQISTLPADYHEPVNNTEDLLLPNLASAGYANLIPVLETIGPDYETLQPVQVDRGTNNSIISYASVGSGAIVITARQVATVLNDTAATPILGVNQGFVAQTPISDSNGDLAGEFAINLIHLTEGFSQNGQASRKANSSPIDVTAPLLKTFTAEGLGSPQPYSPPVEYKGLVFVSEGNRLMAFSAVPGSDLDHDGNPDDGIQDFNLGKGYDLVWESVALQGPLSGAAATHVHTSSGASVDEVFVVDGAGNLDAFNAFPLNAQGSFITTDNPTIGQYASPTGSPTSTGVTPPFAPTIVNDLVYVTDNVAGAFGENGRIWVLDPSTGSNVNGWCIGSPSDTIISNQVSAAATIGYIPIFDNSGGQDEVAYLPTAPNGAGGSSCGIISIWVGTRGEKHALDIEPNELVVSTRAGQAGAPVYDPAGSDLHGIRLTLEDSNGDAISAATMNTLLTGGVVNNNGVLSFTLKPGVTLADFTALNITSIAIDYSIDWDNTNPTVRNSVRGQFHLGDDPNNSKFIVGNLALGPQGYLYASEANPNDGISDGAFYTFQEYGRGTFKVLSRFDLYPQFNLNLTGSPSPLVEKETLEDMDPIQGFAPVFLGGAFSKMTFVSGPAVRGNYVYVKARGYKFRGRVPCSIMMAFSANPPEPSFVVPGNIETGFSLLQPDILRSTSKTVPDTYTQMTNAQFTSEQDLTGTKISFSSLCDTLSGQFNNTFSESLPLILRQNGRPDEVIEPSTLGNWSTLQWYSVSHGVDDGPGPAANFDTGPPVITGDTLFFAGNSIAQNILSGLNPFANPPSGILTAQTAVISTGDPFLGNDPARRPWFQQLNMLRISSPTTIAPNPDILWPQEIGVTSFQQYVQRLLQTTLDDPLSGSNPTCFGLSAGDGNLFAYSNLGLYGYTRADVTVADAGRVATFDPSGNALWSSDQTVAGVYASIAGVPSGITSTISRPTRAYQQSPTNWLVADPGSNRIIDIDKSGKELESISSFVVDPNYVPDGFRSGETISLSQPQDVLTFFDYHTNSPFSNPAPLEKWVHFLIADTGNHRLIELVDRYAVDPITHIVGATLGTHELFYHSPDAYSGKDFAYGTVSRVYSPYSNTYVYAASIGQQTQSRSSVGLDTPVVDPTNGATVPQVHSSGNGNGTIVLIDGSNTQIIDQVIIPTIPAGVVYDQTTGTFNAQPIPQQTMPLGSITSATLSDYFNPISGATEIRLMFTNSTGVYEVTQDPVSKNWIVEWMLPTSAYISMRQSLFNGNLLPTNAAGFQPTYARRETDGTVIVVNGYVGQTIGGAPYSGEVLELEGSTAATANVSGFNFAKPNFGFNSLSIRFELPSVQGARGIEAPVFADRK